MSWIPGWGSIESANSWANFYFWAGICALMLLGVFEVISHRYTERKDELVAEQQAEIQRQHDEQMAVVHNETAKITARAAQLEKEAADAKLELARITTSRAKLLTPEASEKIVETLRPFAGTKFDIGHASSGREQWDFLWVLEPLFPKAGWVFIDWNPGPLPHPGVFGKLNWTMQRHIYGVANVLNVSIELSPEKREELLPAANSLASALNEAGITAVVEPHPISGVSANTDAIHILVGDKG